MNEEALNDSFNLFANEGYNGSIEDYKELINSNEEARNDSFNLFAKNGYNGKVEDFSTLIGASPSEAKTNDSASADPAVESNQNDTGSKSENGSSDSRDASDFENTQEKNTWIEDAFGKNELTDFFGDLIRSGSAGIAAGTSVNEAFDVYKGKDATDEEIYAFLERSRDIENAGQTDEMLAMSEKQAELKKEGYNGVSAFFLGWWDNPSAMLQYSTQSLLQMFTALESDEVVGTAALTAGAGAGVGSAFAGIGAVPGAVAGFFGGLSGSMETGMTTAALIQEEAVKEGLDWGNLSDKERFSYIRKIQNDTEKFNDIKSKAVARGIAIGSIDAITAGLTAGVGGAVGKSVSTGARSSLTNLAKTATVAGIETTGGMVSEVAGQAAAGQEFNLEEILIEGFADKTFTGVSLAQSIKKGNPKYTIKGREVNGKELSETLKILNDSDFVTADISVENSPYVEKLVNNRRRDIDADQRVDSRISDVTDRAEAIKLTRELKILGKEPDGNKNKIAQTKVKLNIINEKYANSEVDVTIDDRQKAVASAVENKFETEFNRNFKALDDAKATTGQEPVLFNDHNSYLDAVEKKFGAEGRLQAVDTDGVFAGGGQVFISKEKARESIDIATGNNGAISVTSHEVLHPIFNALIGGVKEQGSFVKDFKTKMTSKQKAYVSKALKARNYTKDQEATELMNVFSDGILKGDINYDQTFFEKVGDSILGLFKSQGLDNMSFDNGKDVYNFLKEYNTSIKEGKLSDKAISTIKTAENKKKVKVADAKLLPKKQFSISVAEAEANLEAAENSDPDDPAYFDKVDAAEAALEAAEEAAKNPVKKEVEVIKPKVKKVDKPARTTDLGPRDPISLKIMETYNEGMEGVNRESYTAKSPLPQSLEGKLVKMFNGYIAKLVNQKFNQKEAEAIQIDDAKLILSGEALKAIRTFNPSNSKDLAGYVKKIIQTRQSLAFKDVNKEFTEDVSEAKGVVDTKSEQSIDRSGNVERGQATFDQLDIVDDELITSIEKDLSKEIRVRTQKGTLSEMIGVKKGRETYLVTWLDNYVNKQLFKKLSKKLGAIGERNGETVIPGAYIDFLNDPKTFDIITKALPIKSIKKSYGKLFPIERVGRELTAEGNPVFKISKIDKKAFLTYFVKGKKSAILERQKQLFREILEPLAKQVVANYATPENLIELKEIKELAPGASMDIIENITIEAQLNNLESKLDRYKGEQETFDIIQFSKQEGLNENLISKAGLNIESTILKDKAQGKQSFYYDKLKKHYENREAFMEFLPTSVTKFKTLSAGILGFVYREDGSYYDFYKHDYKQVVDKEGAIIKDKKKLNDLFDQGKASFRNKLLDKKEDSSKYSETTKKLLKETDALIKAANLGKKVPNLHAGRIVSAKAVLKPTVEALTAKNLLIYLSKNNPLNKKIGELYISLFRDFINNASNKKEAKTMLVNTLIATSNTVNGWRSLASISSIVYNKNEAVDYRFEHNDSMSSVLPNVLSQILGEGPISFNVDSSLIPAPLAKIKDSNKETKIGNKETTKAFIDNEVKKDNNLGIVSIQLSKSQMTSGPLKVYHGGTVKSKADMKGNFIYFSTDETQAKEYAKGNDGTVQKFIINKENIVDENTVFKVINKLGIQPAAFDLGWKVEDSNLYELIDDRFEQAFSPADLNKLSNALKKKNIQASTFTDTNLITGRDTDNIVVFDTDVLQFSKTAKDLSIGFNNIIENATGIESFKKFSETKGRVVGKNKGRFSFFVPPSADDFSGLLYKLLSKGKKGEQQQAWFKEQLFDPFSVAMRDFETYKQGISKVVKDLKKTVKNVPTKLTKVNESGFTNEQSVRVYLWAINGYDIPGMSKNDQKELVKIVRNNPDLKGFAEQLDNVLGKYPEPENNWLAGSITIDAVNMVNTVKRAEFLKQWQENADAIFSKENLNKLRAAFGDNYVEAIEDVLYRMKSGRNRPNGSNKLTNKFMNWVNDSVGTIMFFNTRSALLQTLSIANFINWGDNNPIQAGIAFSNQKQFWSDFAMLFNSDFLKQRRSGLKNDVNADDIANAAETATNKSKAVLASILKMGFLPTQIADSFAIAMGGASFIRNRINKYTKEGMPKAEAETQAFLDFQEIAEETQQSSRPDRISQQQASPLGRIILAFANTPMQYMRLTKKAFLDLKNGRGDVKTNITKIAYYMAIQNIIFSSLQSALFAAMFDEEEEEKMDKRKLNIANSMSDSILRGLGVYGAIVSTSKNILLEIKTQAEADRPDFTKAAIKALDVSPPISSKMRKLMSAGRAFSYKKTREKMVGFGLDNPAYYAGGQVVSSLTNLPLDRAIKKMDNIRVAMDNETKYWQKLALLLGYSQWDLNLVQKEKTKSKWGKTTTWKKMKWKRGNWSK